MISTNHVQRILFSWNEIVLCTILQYLMKTLSSCCKSFSHKGKDLIVLIVLTGFDPICSWMQWVVKVLSTRQEQVSNLFVINNDISFRTMLHPWIFPARKSSSHSGRSYRTVARASTALRQWESFTKSTVQEQTPSPLHLPLITALHTPAAINWPPAGRYTVFSI